MFRLARIRWYAIAGQAVLGLVAGVTLGAMNVWANHAGDHAIHACVNRLTGATRIVESPDQCTRYERLVEWQSANSTAVTDYTVVHASASASTDDQTDEVDLSVECPENYAVIGGGSGPTFFSGDQRLLLASSKPLSGDQFARDGWTAEFLTVDGENAVGSYGFEVVGVCAQAS